MSSCEEACLSLRERRAESILDAAETLFMEQGYDRTSLAEIVKLSGGSLATLYQLFGNKQGLLVAIAARWRAKTDDLTVHTECPPNRPRSEILLQFARDQIERFHSPRAVALMRMLVSESLRDRDFALQTYKELHLPMIAQMADRFRGWAADDTMEVDNPDEAAHLFLSIITGDGMLGKLAGLDEPLLSDKQVRWRLQPFLTYFKIR